jgi:hypothetical protein
VPTIVEDVGGHAALCLPYGVGANSRLNFQKANLSMPPHSRGAMRPSFDRNFRPKEGVARPSREGAGNAGCPLHPQPRVQSGRKHTSVVTARSTGVPGIPARNGFNGFLRALPGDEFLLPPSSADEGFVEARSGRLSLRRFSTSNGCQDHTTSPSATCAVRQHAVDRSQALEPALPSRHTPDAARVHRIPPRVRDDRDTPLEWDETAGI